MYSIAISFILLLTFSKISLSKELNSFPFTLEKFSFDERKKISAVGKNVSADAEFFLVSILRKAV